MTNDKLKQRFSIRTLMYVVCLIAIAFGVRHAVELHHNAHHIRVDFVLAQSEGVFFPNEISIVFRQSEVERVKAEAKVRDNEIAKLLIRNQWRQAPPLQDFEFRRFWPVMASEMPDRILAPEGTHPGIRYWLMFDLWIKHDPERAIHFLFQNYESLSEDAPELHNYILSLCVKSKYQSNLRRILQQSAEFKKIVLKNVCLVDSGVEDPNSISPNSACLSACETCQFQEVLEDVEPVLLQCLETIEREAHVQFALALRLVWLMRTRFALRPDPSSLELLNRLQSSVIDSGVLSSWDSSSVDDFRKHLRHALFNLHEFGDAEIKSAVKETFYRWNDLQSWIEISDATDYPKLKPLVYQFADWLGGVASDFDFANPATGLESFPSVAKLVSAVSRLEGEPLKESLLLLMKCENSQAIEYAGQRFEGSRDQAIMNQLITIVQDYSNSSDSREVRHLAIPAARALWRIDPDQIDKLESWPGSLENEVRFTRVRSCDSILPEIVEAGLLNDDSNPGIPVKTRYYDWPISKVENNKQEFERVMNQLDRIQKFTNFYRIDQGFSVKRLPPEMVHRLSLEPLMIVAGIDALVVNLHSSGTCEFEFVLDGKVYKVDGPSRSPNIAVSGEFGMFACEFCDVVNAVFRRNEKFDRVVPLRLAIPYAPVRGNDSVCLAPVSLLKKMHAEFGLDFHGLNWIE